MNLSYEGFPSRVISALTSLTTSFPFTLGLTETASLYNAYFQAFSSRNTVQGYVPESDIRDSAYSTLSSETSSVQELTSSSMQEQTTDNRFTRAMNCVFKYDFKVGNYLPDDAKKLNPHLFTTISDITTGIKKSSWFTSNDFSRLMQGNMASHALYFGDSPLFGPDAAKLTSRTADFDSTYSANAPHSVGATPTGGFYNFFLVLSSSTNVLNSR